MSLRLSVLLAVVLVATSACANTYTVKNTDDSGELSLRWCMTQANTNPGPDDIEFSEDIADEYIRLLTPLPPLSDSFTSINGDIDTDGVPDIELRHDAAMTTGHGLQISGSHTRVTGIAIVSMPWCGIWIWNCADVRVRSCYIGLTMDARDFDANRLGGIALYQAEDCQIGGPRQRHRNVVYPGPKAWKTSCIEILASRNNTVLGNYLNILPNASGIFAPGGWGIRFYGPYRAPGRALRLEPMPGTSSVSATTYDCSGNLIGGTGEFDGNVMGGLRQGVMLLGADGNTLQGNTIGLLPDGETEADIGQWCVLLYHDCNDNEIGGDGAAAGNVFAASPVGVLVMGTGISGNAIRGSRFGMNAAGTARRRLRTGIMVTDGDGLMVGGSSPGMGNYFTPNAPDGLTYAITLAGGRDAIIRNNHLGQYPDGSDAGDYSFGVGIIGPSPRILDNEIVKAQVGIGSAGGSTNFQAYRNTFARCNRAVLIDLFSRGRLGNLENTSGSDDGGNVFDGSCTWFIRNQTPHAIKAEGNDFGTTDRAAINAKVWDDRDHPRRGRVDFDPLNGGVSPTGGVLGVSGLAAIPTTTGVELAFTLSSEAAVTVTVTNLAGRPVATIARDASLPEGLQRLSWNGRGDTGATVPDGRYLVSIEARTEEGQVARALAPVVLGR